MIELSTNKHFSTSISMRVDVEKWIIVGNLRNNKKTPFKVTQIHFSVDPSEDMRSGIKSLSVQGHWAQSNGYKWQTRATYFGWHGGEYIGLADLPKVIQDHIYAELLDTAKVITKEVSANTKLLEEANGKFRMALPNLDEENPDPFLPSVKTAGPSKWENMDVSAWSVARKELGLPKPKVIRKKKVKV